MLDGRREIFHMSRLPTRMSLLFFATRFLLLFRSHFCRNCSFTRRYQHDSVLELFLHFGRRTNKRTLFFFLFPHFPQLVATYKSGFMRMRVFFLTSRLQLGSRLLFPTQVFFAVLALAGCQVAAAIGTSPISIIATLGRDRDLAAPN